MSPNVRLEAMDTPTSTRAGWGSMTWLGPQGLSAPSHATFTLPDDVVTAPAPVPVFRLPDEVPSAPEARPAASPPPVLEDRRTDVRRTLGAAQARVRQARATLETLAGQLDELVAELEEVELRTLRREVDPHRQALRASLDAMRSDRRAALEEELLEARAIASRRVVAARRTMAAVAPARSGDPMQAAWERRLDHVRAEVRAS